MALVNVLVVLQVLYLPVVVQQSPLDKNNIETQTFGIRDLWMMILMLCWVGLKKLSFVVSVIFRQHDKHTKSSITKICPKSICFPIQFPLKSPQTFLKSHSLLWTVLSNKTPNSKVTHITSTKNANSFLQQRVSETTVTTDYPVSKAKIHLSGVNKITP